jgi:hypothetical protein
MFFRRIAYSITQFPYRAFWRAMTVTFLALLFLLTVRGTRPDPGNHDFMALGLARDHLFDFAKWEIDAATDKAANSLIAPERAMSTEERTQYVRDYLDLVGHIDDLEDQVTEIYENPNYRDPLAASADLRAERDTLRVEQESKQAIAEAIVQSQVSELLVDYGFGTGGAILPPVSFRFTQLPTILIISKRDKIERTGAYPLEHGITVDQMTSLEANLDSQLNVSSLVAPLGGLAVYPAMLIETGYLPSVMEITAHEWTHHYLAFHPLGLNYGLSPALYTLNETTASIVGREIGWAVLDRYYPDLAGPPPDYTPQPPPPEPSEATPAVPVDPLAFDFNAEMRETRVKAEELLAEGKIEEAEKYMAGRRLIFVGHGYRIRKLNQAYFAFYGSYADQPGATGQDPIGPALRDLRYYSGSLVEFIRRVQGITTADELFALVEKAKDSNP